MSPENQPGLQTPQDRVLSDPRLRKAYEYWLSKRTAERLPSRRDMDPVDISICLSGVLLFDVLDDGTDYRIRLAGSHVEEAYGRSLKGIRLRELLGAQPGAEEVLERLRQVVVTCEPDFRSAPVVVPERSFLSFDRVALPLAEDGRRVSHLFCCFAYSQRRNVRPRP